MRLVDEYYEPAATHRLERSLCVIGFLNRVSRFIGMAVASLIGAPCNVLDEILEHRMGAATHEILASIGMEGFRDAEARELRRLLSHKPPGVVVLGEGALTDPSVRALAGSQAHVLWIRQSLSEVERLLSTRTETRARTLVAELDAIPGCEAERLEALYALRAREHGFAPLTLDVSGSDYRRAARACLELLETRRVLARA